MKQESTGLAPCERQRFRIGNYRVIFDIKEDQIIILRVGHRGRIYRNI
ncbi:MAG: type II toxin-antitoxin system RelE/ParE family toxin [Nanoarchaeota archaeon]|nr:type II toxin-antitoxin system RelE/ParE family toxin [Nanoarchaeota archaeon]